MNDGSPRCSHGALAAFVPRPDLGEGWVQPIAGGCKLCQANPQSVRLPFKLGEPQVAPGAPLAAPAPAELDLAKLATAVAKTSDTIFANTVRNPNNWLRLGLPLEEPARSDKIDEFSKKLGGAPAEIGADFALWKTGT
jgi:hypothetical protein